MEPSSRHITHTHTHTLSTMFLILRKLPRKLARQRIEAERLQDKLLQDYLKRKDTVEIVKEQVNKGFNSTILRSHVHLRRLNVFKKYYIVSNTAVSIPNVWGTIDRLVAQGLQP